MNDPGMLQLLMATEPKRLARLPEVPLDRALAEAQALKAAATASPATEEATVAPQALDGPLAALATNIWRAQAKMIDPKTGEPREETRRLYRHIEGALEAFAAMGVRLSDWVGQPYDAGLPLKVISFQPITDVTRDTVVEAVRPAVFWQDRLLQVGEVIVGIPPTPSKQP